jgi:hypothetical protein
LGGKLLGGWRMTCLKTEKLSPWLREKISPFFHEILKNSAPQIHSLYLVGSVLTEDYLEKVSDINSVIVLQEMALDFLDILAPLGKKYGKKGIAVPLVMDSGYLQSSLDVFPLEFLNFKLVHHALYGEDLLAGLEINKQELRRQCEREIKGKLVWLQRSYVSSRGEKKVLAANIVSHLGGYLPLLRGILYLLGQDPPLGLKKVLDRLFRLTGTETEVFEEIYAIKKNLSKPSKEELSQLFAKFYGATEKLAEVVDGLQI